MGWSSQEGGWRPRTELFEGRWDALVVLVVGEEVVPDGGGSERGTAQRRGGWVGGIPRR